MSQKQKPEILWALPIRLFHWSLVGCIIGASVSAEAGAMTIHQIFGFLVLALLLFRILYGLWGPRASRFGFFLRGVRAFFRSLRLFFKRRADPSYGGAYDALSGWAVVGLLTFLMILGVLGLFSEDDVLFSGPLVFLVSESIAERLTAAHAFLGHVLPFVILLHVTVVLWYQFGKRASALRKMVLGKQSGEMEIGSYRPLLLFSLAVFLSLALLAGLFYLADLFYLTDLFYLAR